MTALTPLSRFEDLFSEFRRMVPSLAQSTEIIGMGDIRLDVEERDKSYAVCAELPGVKKEDIRLEVDGNRVAIHAEVRGETEERDPKDKARVLVRETYRGSVSRSFTLPSEIDESGVAAKLEDGVLRLTLPKREGARRRRIAIE